MSVCQHCLEVTGHEAVEDGMGQLGWKDRPTDTYSFSSRPKRDKMTRVFKNEDHEFLGD